MIMIQCICVRLKDDGMASLI